MIERYILSNPSNMVHICFDFFEDYQIQGKAYSSTQMNPIEFHDISELVVQIDNLFNQNGKPLPFEEIRSFTKKPPSASYQYNLPKYHDYHELQQILGKTITVDIVVLSRRKASWQGILFYNDKEVKFSDALELIKEITNLLIL